MKNLIKLIAISIVGLFVLTGCTASATYNQNYISKNIKTKLPKVEKNICISDMSNPKKTKAYRGQIEFTTGETNINVLKNYLSQYFNSVKLNNSKDCYISISSQVSNLKASFTNLDGMDADFDLNIVVTKNKRIILNKNYHGYKDSQVMIALGIIGLSAPYKTANEAFHKELLELYENEVEKDLLTSLRENM